MAKPKRKMVVKKLPLEKEIIAVPLPTLPVIASESHGDDAKGKGNLGMGTSVLSLQCPYC